MTAPSMASVRSGNLVHLGQMRRWRRQKYLINCLKMTFATVFVGLVMFASPREPTSPWSSTERTTSKTLNRSKKNFLSKALPAYDGIDILVKNKEVDRMLKDVALRTNNRTQSSVGVLKQRLGAYMITGSAHRTVEPSSREDGVSVRIWIAGSSAAAGYGNLPSQSYVSVLSALLSFEGDVLFPVQSSAMFNISPFPHAWCLFDHHWGGDINEVPEVVVYDFDEDISQPDPLHLETFIRMVATLRPDVMVIVRGPPNDAAHSKLLQTYVSVVNIVVIADLSGESMDDATTIGGFGLPASVESLHSHNLSIQQHAWTALLMALHILGATQPTGNTEAVPRQPSQTKLPPHLYPPPSPMFDPEKDTISCRTSYDFVDVIREGRGQELRYDTSEISTANLHEIFIGEKQPVDWKTATSLLLLPKNPSNFRRGWAWAVADRMSKLRQTTFRQRDWKVAVYGLAMSGPLQLQLPSSPTADRQVLSVMVCQADDSDVSGCLLGKDGDLTANVPLTTMETSNKLCLLGRLGDDVGAAPVLLLNVTVSTTRKPCSVAHVIWTTVKRL